jgi:hypothetical protein
VKLFPRACSRALMRPSIAPARRLLSIKGECVIVLNR